VAKTELPDDSSRWPGDPYALLGVGRQDDEREVRREYTRLIRRFRPDHHPAEFQKIREAFEFIQRQQQARKSYYTAIELVEESTSLDQEEEEPSLHRDDEDSEIQAVSSSPDVKTSKPHPPSSETVPPTLSEIWELAMEGDEAAAYAFLLERRYQVGRDEQGQLHARLYWLLTMNRGLDSARVPCDWLAAGLRLSRLSGPLLELYRRELAASPDEAASVRCGSLAEGSPHVRGLVQLLTWRWRGCARIYRHELIVQDLDRVRTRLVFEDEASWCRLLILACELLAFCRLAALRALRNDFVVELKQLTHLHQEFADELDRLDLLEESAQGWGNLLEAKNIPDQWKEMVLLSWTCDWDDLRGPLLNLVSAIAASPPSALQALDLIAAHVPAAATQLGQLLHRYWRETLDGVDPPGRDWDEAVAAVAIFLRARQMFDYDQMRGEILLHCLHETIPPLTFAEAADHTELRTGSFQDRVRNDGPLQNVYVACQAFWW
jgi:hypothetical protein